MWHPYVLFARDLGGEAIRQRSRLLVVGGDHLHLVPFQRGRLSGKTPFEAEDEKELFHRIKNAKIEFPDQQWKYISCSAKDFILRLLDRNPKKRYKADKIRTHPWIISDHKEELLYRERRDNLKRYEASRQVEKIKFMIEKTMVELSEMQDNGEIDLSMIDEAE
jgi:serine/threonine protein kinase